MWEPLPERMELGVTCTVKVGSGRGSKMSICQVKMNLFYSFEDHYPELMGN
jgi:hypothetical protein